MALSTSIVNALRGTALRGLAGLPAPAVRRLAGDPIEINGRTLDPQMQLMLKLQKLDGPPIESLSISKGRRALTSSSQLVGGKQPIGAVTDRDIPGPAGPLTLRFYTPRELQGPAPALVFFHGGGWIYGDLESHDALCRVLAEQAQVRVIAVDYRLAPEAPFPAAFDDCWAAWRWVVSNAEGIGVDPRHLAVGGDSAGGNLAALVAQHAVGDDVAPIFQLLIYPATDFVEKSASRKTYASGFFLTSEFMALAEENYLVGDEELTDRRLSPLHQDVTGVAPAYVVTAGFDPLLDEGEAYAEKMKAAGVAVEYRCEEGLIHGFANLVAFGSVAPKAVKRMSTALQRGLS